FGRVDGRAATHADEAVPGGLTRELGRGLDALISGLDVHLVVDLHVQPTGLGGFRNTLRHTAGGDTRIRHDQNSPCALLGEIESDLIYSAHTELQRGASPGEDRLMLVRGHRSRTPPSTHASTSRVL